MKKEKIRLGVSILFTVAAVIEILIVFLIIAFFSYLLEIPQNNISANVLIWILAVMIGGTMSWFVNKILIKPIERLSDAMDEVANGNFDIHLESENRIREIKNIYDKFNIMTKELRSTEILQSDFVSNVSHEIKTPITSIEGYTMLLQDDEISEENKKEFINKILYNTRRLSELVGNILLLSKIENQVIETKKKAFRLDEQIRQSILLMEPKWLEKGIEFDVEFESVTYDGNEYLLQHVWNNLIDNAIKFSPQNGIIKMSLTSEGSFYVFDIEDEGMGIPKDLQKKVFNKFYQTDSSRKQEGNGLGLALVKQILDLCGGQVFVEDVTPKGCRFIVKLIKVKE